MGPPVCTTGTECSCEPEGLQVGETLCANDRRKGWATHWGPHEDGFVVVDVLQGHLQRLHGLIWHRLAQVTGHQDELSVEEHRVCAPGGHYSGARSPPSQTF